MRKLIIVKGVTNVGKTSTLEALIKRLLDNGYHLIHPATEAEITSFVICEKDSHRVGVITFGDPSTQGNVQICLNQCRNTGCDTIFAASRTSGAVYNLLYNFASTNGYATIETSPLYAYQYWTTSINIAPLHQLFAKMLSNLI